jgi:hypothetical protein
MNTFYSNNVMKYKNSVKKDRERKSESSDASEIPMFKRKFKHTDYDKIDSDRKKNNEAEEPQSLKVQINEALRKHNREKKKSPEKQQTPPEFVSPPKMKLTEEEKKKMIKLFNPKTAAFIQKFPELVEMERSNVSHRISKDKISRDVSPKENPYLERVPGLKDDDLDYDNI